MRVNLSHKIQSVKINQENYPESLKGIEDGPETLYFRGKLLPKESCFAIVGTRRCSDYGKEIAFSIARELGQAGLTIVSGMARGIDTFAHQGALESAGRTIAVLGTGLNEKIIYPQENLALAKKILDQQGCLISEYPSDTPGMKGNFPARNRIISGLSLGVLVVEAKFGSGALITADWANKQGRKIFAVPGPVHSSNSKGCHFLLKQGAVLVEKADDILKQLKCQTLPFIKKQIKPANETENLILELLKQENLHIDKIIEKTKLATQQISSALSLMEIDDKVRNLGGNVYALMR